MKDLHANNWLLTILEIDRDVSYMFINQLEQTVVQSIIFFYEVEVMSSKTDVHRNSSTWEINSIALKC